MPFPECDSHMNHQRITLLTLITILVALPLQAQDLPSPKATPDSPAEITVLVRISSDLFTELISETVDMTVPVDRPVDNFRVTGTATGKGVTKVMLIESDRHAECEVVVTGVAVGKLRSDLGPVIGHMTTRSHFTTSKTIRFTEEEFLSEPAETDAQNCSKIDRVCAKRRGPIGKVVQRIGYKMANKSLGEINAIAQQVSSDMLSSTMDSSVEDLVDELNEDTQLGQLVEKYFPETKQWQPKLATRTDFLLMGYGPPDATLPVELTSSQKPTKSLIELWIKLSPAESLLLNLMSEMEVGYDLLRDHMSEEEAKALADDVKLDRDGDWTVIRFGLPKNSSAPQPSGAE